VGQIKNGVITSIADFGAFVDVDGIDGLIHISELSWNHVKHPSEVIKINDQVSVEVLDVDFDKQRLSLGLKQTQKDPWLEKIKNFKIKDVVQGKVTRIVKFGLFVQIETGMEGLVHISELSPEQIKRPSDVAKIGDELIVRIIDIDFDKRRMAFSVKQVEFPEAEEEKGEVEKIEEEKGEVEKSEKPKSSKKADAKKAKEEEASEVEKENAEQKESKSTSPEFEAISQKEKKETIKKILSELKKEANLE